jgi:hypothetical protein
LSRHSALHHAIRRLAYALLSRVPDRLKYAVGTAWRRIRLPYRLLRAGDVVIQIGAPRDTLLAGRSRSAHFAGLIGQGGRVLVIEPEEQNLSALRRGR